jgi:hypothetical protein
MYIPVVAGGRLLRAEQQAMCGYEGNCATDSVMWCVEKCEWPVQNEGSGRLAIALE